jgi:nucleotide-binding universal stress UspA family protein
MAGSFSPGAGKLGKSSLEDAGSQTEQGANMPGIIVGVDGSAHSLRALDWALREAQIRSVPLTVIAVNPALVSYWGAVTYPEGKADQEHERQEVQAAVDKATSSLNGQLPQVTVTVTPGSPATRILEAAQDADMVVVGSRGSGGFSRLMLGSVSTQVAQHATCPVVVIPGHGKG